MLEGLKLAGLILTGAGLGLSLFLYFLDAGQPDGVFVVGLIPFFVGLAMLIYARSLGPSAEERPRGSSRS
jgi:hypothetical protein